MTAIQGSTLGQGRQASGHGHLPYDSDIAPVAALLADRARAAIMLALLDGLPRAAGELSKLAGVSPATTSAHLARLRHGGMLAVEQQGRHRYYRMAGPDVAALVEYLAQVSPAQPPRGLRQSREAAALAGGRSCYDHLAGRAGVALLDALLEQEILTPLPDGNGPAGRPGRQGDSAFEVTGPGEQTLGAFGVDVAEVRRARRRLAGYCLDWTERRPHLNGALGAAIMTRLLQLGWIERGPVRRSMRVTPAGRAGLATTFGWAPAEPVDTTRAAGTARA